VRYAGCGLHDMQNMPTITGIALLVLCGLTGYAPGQALEGTVRVRQGKARFAHSKRSGEARHALKLSLLVSPKYLPDFHVPEEHVLRATLGGTTLLDVAPGADGYRQGKGGRWRYRGEIAGGRVTLRANGLTGKVKLKISGADLPGLHASNATDLPLTLELTGALLETTASFAVKDSRVRRWRGLAFEFIPGTGGGPGTDPDPGTDPGPGDPPLSGAALKNAILADLQARGVSFFQNGTREPAGGFNRQTLRCPSGALAEVVGLSAPPPPGGADYFSDTAYVCRDSGQYWAHRTGGFAGVSLWVGPYPLP